MTTDATTERAAFDGLCDGGIARPSDAAHDAARLAWNLVADARPRSTR
jgi:hypothetical protein